MKSHTPGPWRVVKRANQQGIQMLCVDTNTQAGGAWTVRKDILTEQNVADAILIAGAPQLLKALELLIASVGSDPFALTKKQRGDMDFARVAVIKATQS